MQHQKISSPTRILCTHLARFITNIRKVNKINRKLIENIIKCNSNIYSTVIIPSLNYSLGKLKLCAKKITKMLSSSTAHVIFVVLQSVDLDKTLKPLRPNSKILQADSQSRY